MRHSAILLSAARPQKNEATRPNEPGEMGREWNARCEPRKPSTPIDNPTLGGQSRLDPSRVDLLEQIGEDPPGSDGDACSRTLDDEGLRGVALRVEEHDVVGMLQAREG